MTIGKRVEAKKIASKNRVFFYFSAANTIYHISHDSLKNGGSAKENGLRRARCGATG